MEKNSQLALDNKYTNRTQPFSLPKHNTVYYSFVNLCTEILEQGLLVTNIYMDKVSLQRVEGYVIQHRKFDADAYKHQPRLTL